MKRFLLFTICCISISVSAQDLTGIWRGGFRSTAKNRLMEMLGQDDRYKFEVQIDQQDKRFSGVTYSYLTTVFYGKATCEGTVNPTTHKVLLEEIKIVEQRMSGGGGICIMTLFLQYSKVGEEEFLEGTYSSMKTSDSTDCGKGTVFLRKVPTSDFYKEPFLVEKEKEAEKNPPPPVAKKIDSAAIVKKTTPATKPPATVKKPVTGTAKTTPPVKKPVTTPPANNTAKNNAAVKKPTLTPPPPTTKVPEPNLATKPLVDSAKKVEKPIVTAPPAPVPKILLTRENELVKTITTSAKELNIRIYDNGAVDNDTISVYLDKKLVLSKKRLTEKAITLTVKLDDDENYHELVMVAENLGEIPPNTSLMIVDAGKQQYEVRITSTEQKNAVIVFKYKPGP
ncbi:hypothetical protein D3H65_12870 [Paraflavitalea soli]|uniref:Uncharacterized protein n=1 Tax=Paraflavitalea soli TaxID=2315862 RepID=A0A3B7MP43_9BACT|nr:hypothetical protein [Paraflavitalea soli]AXY74820.1 hypothetical protein D3H65_12870 [Paraflavitalea soli]